MKHIISWMLIVLFVAGTISQTPAADEILSPGEFSAAHGVFLGWSEYQKVELKDIAFEVSKVDTVYVVHMQGQDLACKSYFTENNVNMDNVQFINADTNEVSCWIRDYGSFYVYEDGTRAVVQYDYKNYPTNPIPPLLADLWGLELYHGSLRFSGGNLMCDGNGMGFLGSVLLEENIGWSEDSIQNNFKKYLGLDSIVLVRSMKMDGTGHIDMAQKLLNDTLIIVGEYAKASDAYGQNKKILDDNADSLSKMKNLDGRSFNVVRIPMPPLYYNGTKPVTSSYTNSLIINDLVLVPIYGDSLAQLDSVVLNLYKELMPDYKIIGINSAEVIKSNGAVHCITNTHFHENPLMVFHNYFDTAVANEEPVINFRLNPKFKTMTGSVFYKAESDTSFTEVKAELKNGIFSATLPEMGENFKYYFTGSATWGTGELSVKLPKDAPTNTFSAVVIPTGIKENMLAGNYIKLSHYPNPFNAKTTIRYAVKKDCNLVLSIHDVHGRKVRSLANGFHKAGAYQNVWKGTNRSGEKLAGGVYYLVLTIVNNDGGKSIKKDKLVIIR